MKFRTILLGAAASLSVGTAAQAQLVTGGGSTLASPTYLTEFGVFQNNNPDTNFSNTYKPEGSGAAQTSVVTNSPAGFDFGASDALVSSGNLDTYTKTQQPADGNLVVLPTFGVPITVPLNFSGVASNSAVNLTDAQLCGVFSGKITNTSDSALAGSGLPPNQPITVAYRTEGSGTTFLFTQHLAAVCTSSTSNITFSAVTMFSTLFPGNPGTPPANFKGGAGSPGVQGVVDNNASSIGYLSPDYTQIVASPNTTGGPAPYVATVDGVSPTVANVANALSTAPTPTIDTSNPNSAIPVVANPSKGYPIVGYTTFLMPQCFADPTVATALKSFISATYRQTIYRTIISNGGFATPPSALVSLINSTYLGSSNTSLNGAGSGGCSGSSIVGR